ncbi:hypothetical protein F7725_007305 [Dissostichus mawsoni]|uniref:Uncharacterized protein n=1 Tax=Dissostichus mawsoni TaxID=36200 RepID=A0A7J5XXD4_DISMA|nr:hypothetical protein F7725_007305 [Dissostichus mawsoni]
MQGNRGTAAADPPPPSTSCFSWLSFASAYTIPAVSGDIPAPTAALLRNRARQIHAAIFSERHDSGPQEQKQHERFLEITAQPPPPVSGQFQLEPLNATVLHGSAVRFNATVQGAWKVMT